MENIISGNKTLIINLEIKIRQFQPPVKQYLSISFNIY